ncbi:MAG: phospho-N-acetylmuramoyl-pentapeptide-transferase [Clostridia bacterium]|nr:phospho-N-acetylmuramoyl-pentapeptide-transferase [Clostridia bacterium]
MDYAIYVGASFLGMSLTALILKYLIPALREYKIGQRILTDGPGWHKSKEGTPTMGGIAFGTVIPGIFLLFGLFALNFWDEGIGSVSDLYPAITVSAYGFLCGLCGVADDICKLKHKANNGLTAWQKYLLLLIVTVGFLFVMNRFCGLDTQLYIPFFDVHFELGSWYWVFAVILLTGTVNAVNLTDGIDGLCGSVSATVALFFFACAIAASAFGLALLSCAAFGGCLGFLLFNAYPARVFMGDTGSLFLGALLSGLAFALDLPVFLFLVGAVYMLEAFSVIMQVLYFKATGKRIFKMAPFHHHLEKSGWSEKRIVWVFTALTASVAVVCGILLISGNK